MRLHKKLNRWQREGLIDQQAVDAIIEYEGSSSQSMVLWAVGGIGAFAIVVGLVSVVAANWLHLSDLLKLSVALAVCAGLALAIYYRFVRVQAAKVEEGAWLNDVLITIYYGLVLATMALIGQVYQLDGSIAGLLLAWSVATLPMIFLASGRFVAMLWVFAVFITYYLNMIELHDYAIKVWQLSRPLIESVIQILFFLGPLLFIALSRISYLRKHGRWFAKELSDKSWLLVVVAGFFAQFLWYGKGAVHEVSISVLVVTGLATAVMLVCIPRLYAEHDHRRHLAMRVVLLSVYVLGFIAFWHASPLKLLGALTNLLYLCVLAWAAIKLGSKGLFNFVTAVIALRILFIYFEVFGSMMQTGIGLIVGGALTLLLAWLWFKKSNRLALELSSHNTAVAAAAEGIGARNEK